MRNLYIIESYIWSPHILRVLEIALKERKSFNVEVYLIFIDDYYELSSSCKKNYYVYNIQKILYIAFLAIAFFFPA